MVSYLRHCQAECSSDTSLDLESSQRYTNSQSSTIASHCHDSMLIQTYGQYNVPLDAEGHLGLTKAYVHKDNLLLSGCKCHLLDCQDIPTM